MAPTLVQATPKMSAGSVASMDTLYVNPPVQGDLLVCVAAGDALPSMTSTGWTLGPDATDFVGFRMWYKIAGAAESSTVTITPAVSDSLAVWIAEYSGNTTGGVLDKTATAIPGTTTATCSSGTTATTTKADDLSIAAWAWQAGPTPLSYSNGYVQAATGTGVGGVNVTLAVATLALTATQTTGSTITLSGTVGHPSGMVATFKSSPQLPTVAAGTAAASPLLQIANLPASAIEYHLSANSGSLGGAIAGTVTSGVSDNVWDDPPTTGNTEYRCIYVKNTDALATLFGATMWVDAAPGQGSVAIGLDSAAVGSTAASSSANSTTAPSPTITFSAPTTQATGLAIGNIGPGQYKAVWLCRTIPGGATAGADSLSIRVAGLSP